jgi:hypothetical protein
MIEVITDYYQLLFKYYYIIPSGTILSTITYAGLFNSIIINIIKLFSIPAILCGLILLLLLIRRPGRNSVLLLLLRRTIIIKLLFKYFY